MEVQWAVAILQASEGRTSGYVARRGKIRGIGGEGGFFEDLHFHVLVVLVVLKVIPKIVMACAVLRGCRGQTITVLARAINSRYSVLYGLVVERGCLGSASSRIMGDGLRLFSGICGKHVLLTSESFGVIDSAFRARRKGALLDSLTMTYLGKRRADGCSTEDGMLRLTIPMRDPSIRRLRNIVLMDISTISVTRALTRVRRENIVLVKDVIILSTFLT